MGVFNAGLPSSASSSSGSSSNLPIGAQVLMAATTAPMITMADGSVWLRSGVGVSPANYPQASKLDHLMLVGSDIPGQTINSFVPSVNTQVAANGSGVVVVPTGNSSVGYSTNYGSTWTYGGDFTTTIPITSAIWAGNRFIIGGTKAGAGGGAVFYHSTNGFTGYSSQYSATSSAFSEGAVAMAYNPSTGTVMAILAMGSQCSLMRCTSGSSFGNAVAGGSGNTTGNMVAIAYGGGYFVAASSTNVYVSSDDGLTFNTIGLAGLSGGQYTPNTGNYVGFINGAFVVSMNGVGQYAYATNPTALANWSLKNSGLSGNINSASGTVSCMASDGNVLVLVSTDSSNFPTLNITKDGLSWASRNMYAGQFQYPIPAFLGGGKFMIINSQGLICRSNNINVPDYIGVYRASGVVQSGGALILYSRIK